MSEELSMLIRNANVITCDEVAPHANWIRVVDGVIAEVGDGDAPAPREGERVRDLGGRTVMPGLVDGHTHLAFGGARGNTEVELPQGLGSVEELVDVLSAAADGIASGAWLIAGPVPTAVLQALDSLDSLALIDAATGNTPMLLRDETIHNRAVNSAALARMDSLDFSGAGRVAHADGRPTGVLWEQASLLGERAAAADRAEGSEREAIAIAMHQYNGFGVTTVQDAATSLSVLESLRQMEREGTATLRTVASLLFNDPGLGVEPSGADLIAATAGISDTPLTRRSFAKVFLDGVPSSHTAAYHEPYLVPGAHPNGVLNLSEAELVDTLCSLGEACLGAKIHVLGDLAVSVAISATAAARDRGYRETVQLAHAKNIAPEEVERLSGLDIVIDASPPAWHPSSITQAIVRALGEDRAVFRSPHRSILDAGVVIVGGTDWPVVPSPSPWFGIESMVTRADPSGAYPGVSWPEQAVSVEEALAAHTSGAARGLGLADTTGRIAPGLSADLAVLDRDPLAIPPHDLHLTRAVETILAGATVYAEGADPAR